MDSKARIAQILSAANVQNNTNPPPVGLNQVQPLAPPSLTPTELLTANIADYRDPKTFDGMKAYRYACILRAQNQRLSLPLATVSCMAVQLWYSEPANIQQNYKDIANQATRMYGFHHRQVSPEHVRVYTMI